MTPAGERAVLERAAKECKDLALELADKRIHRPLSNWEEGGIDAALRLEGRIRSLPLESKESEQEPAAWVTEDWKVIFTAEGAKSVSIGDKLYLHPPQCAKCAELEALLAGQTHIAEQLLGRGAGDDAYILGLQEKLTAAEEKCTKVEADHKEVVAWAADMLVYLDVDSESLPENEYKIYEEGYDKTVAGLTEAIRALKEVK